MTTGAEFGLFFLGAISGVLLLPATYHIAKYIYKKKCWVNHEWNHYQGTLKLGDVNMNGRNTEINVVMAFKVCSRCAKSRLIHLLY
jgi:hypothetical protein